MQTHVSRLRNEKRMFRLAIFTVHSEQTVQF